MGIVPTDLELAVGEYATITLPGLGTSGYVWEHEVMGGAGSVDLSWSVTSPAGGSGSLVGASRSETLRITGLQPGDVEVRIYQHRPWEPTGEVIAEHYL